MWLPISWPSRCTRCMSPMFSCASAPIIMKVPLTSYFFEDVEDFRSPLGIGAVVEREGDFIGMVAVVLNGVGVRIHIHVLVDDELFARVWSRRCRRSRCACLAAADQ